MLSMMELVMRRHVFIAFFCFSLANLTDLTSLVDVIHLAELSPLCTLVEMHSLLVSTSGSHYFSPNTVCFHYYLSTTDDRFEQDAAPATTPATRSVTAIPTQATLTSTTAIYCPSSYRSWTPWPPSMTSPECFNLPPVHRSRPFAM